MPKTNAEGALFLFVGNGGDDCLDGLFAELARNLGDATGHELRDVTLLRRSGAAFLDD